MIDLGLILSGLNRNLARTILLVFATFIAFFIFGGLSGFKASIDALVENSPADRLVTINKINFTVSLPFAYYGRVQGIDGVEQVAHANWFGGYYQEPVNVVPMFAVSPEPWIDIYSEYVFVEGSAEDFLADRQGAIVSSGIAEANDWSLGDRVPINSNIYSNINGTRTWELNIRGIFTIEGAGSGGGGALMHYDYFNESITFGRDSLGWLVVKADNPTVAPAVSQTIDALFANSEAETQTSTEGAFNSSFLEQQVSLGFIVTAVSSAAFFSILLIVGNAMVVAVRERTAEIAVMKTLGFPSARIFRLVLGECFAIAVLGAGLGLLAITGVFSLLALTPAPIPVLSLDQGTLLQAAFFTFVLALLSGLLPATNALRLNVITALGRE